jgi:polyvinyl alcohol dehydrogenase (cytochrome)
MLAAGAAAPPAAGGGSVAQAGNGGAPAGGVSQWAMIGYDVANTYNNTAETVLTKANAASLDVLWQVDMGGNIYGAPLIIGNTVYASSGGGSSKSLDLETGKPGWTSAALRTTGSMAYENGVLYAYSITGSVTAADAMTGMMKWAGAPKGNPGGDGSSSPIIAGDVILIGGSDGGSEIIGGRFRGFLAALDKAGGQGVWTTFTVPETAAGASLWNSAAVDLEAGRAYGATGNNHGAPNTDSSDALIAFDLKTGEIKWKNQRTMGDVWNGTAGTTDADPPDADFGASPVLYQTMVNGVPTKLVSAGQKIGAAHAVRAEDGMLVWTRQLCTGMNTRDGKMGIFVNGAWSGKNMLFACNNAGKSQLFGLDGATGEIAWMTPLDGEVYGRISSTNGVGFVGAGTNMVVFDTDTGMVIKTFPSKGGTVAGTIAIANGHVAYGEGLSWANGVAGRTLTMLKVK